MQVLIQKKQAERATAVAQIVQLPGIAGMENNSVLFEFHEDHPEEADLVIMGFSLKKLKKEKGGFFKKFENVKDILFVRAGQKIVITDRD